MGARSDGYNCGSQSARWPGVENKNTPCVFQELVCNDVSVSTSHTLKQVKGPRVTQGVRGTLGLPPADLLALMGVLYVLRQVKVFTFLS